MPTLEKIVIRDFRNIELQELEFSPNVNCISGGNGEGKTNLLDAIWYLSMTKSAFSPSDRFNFRHGTDSFAIGATCRMNGGVKSRFAIQVEAQGGKKLLRDDKPYVRIGEHIGVLPIVMVSPADTAMISESGEERRKFANSVLSQMNPTYLSDIMQYNRLLLQRNKLLKSGVSDADLLESFDVRLSRLATPVFEARRTLAAELAPSVSEYYASISGGRESIGIEFHSDLEKGSLEDILKQTREKDAIFKYTTAGIQRDDFVFTMDGYPIRRCGSQGQQKSFLVALKFAQYDIMKSSYGYAPILLLDDLFDKLDINRVGNLLKMVAGNDFGQIFLTDSNKTRINGIVDGITSDRKYFETSGGVFSNE